jgi:arsenical pump membrane protein
VRAGPVFLGGGLNVAVAESLSVAALAVVLAWAVVRPFGWPEAVAAVPAAVLVIGSGAIPAHDAAAEARRLGPVIGFLAAVLVLAQLCDDEGLFRAFGAWMARASAGQPRRLLALGSSPPTWMRARRPPRPPRT